MIKTTSFTLDMAGMRAWEAFLNDPAISVKERLFSPSPTDDSGDIVYYAYETLEAPMVVKAKKIDDEKQSLRALICLAIRVSHEDVEKLPKLKNQQMRDDLLLVKYDICSKDAGRVCDLLKPEMSDVLGWSG